MIAPATSYRVTWENRRIGRTRNNDPVVFDAVSADDLAGKVFRHARPKVMSRDVQVVLDLPDGPGDVVHGHVFCGAQVGARFAIETVDDPDADPR